MNKQNEYRMEIEDLLRRVSNRKVIEISNEIDAERKKILKLLENGKPLLETVSNKNLNELYDLRQKLWIKIQTIDKCASIILNYLQ